MKITAKELKRRARENLTARYNIPMGAFVFAGGIILAIELPFSMLQNPGNQMLQTIIFYIAEYLISLIYAVLSIGQLKIHLGMARKQQYSISQLFYGFKNQPDRTILSAFFISLITAVLCIPSLIGILLIDHSFTTRNIILCIVLTLFSITANIYAHLYVGLTFYFVLDHPQLSSIECMKKSCQFMKGQKGRLFYLFISFIGMYILVILSLGIGSLWIIPYQKQTLTLFYLDVIGEYDTLTQPQTDPNTASGTSFNQYV